MIKNTIYIITILTLSFFATSCCNKKSIKIKNKDKLRFHENDKFIYKSNLGNYDTLFIKEIKSKILYEGTTGEFFCPERKIYIENIHYYYDNYTEPFHKDSLLFFIQSYKEDENELSFAMGISFNHNADSFYVEGEILHTFYKSTGAYIGDCFLGDSLYKNTRVTLYNDTSLRYGPNKFYYNKKYGFLSYEYRSEEKYALIKYIPQNN